MLPMPQTSLSHTMAADGPGPPHVRYQPMVIVLLAAAAGIIFDRLCPLPIAGWWSVAACLLILWGVLRRTPRDGLCVALLLSAVGCIAAAWHHASWYLIAADDISRFARPKAEPVCVEGRVVTSPRRMATPSFDPMRITQLGERSRLTLQLSAIRDGVQWRPVSGRVMLYVSGEPPAVHAGDRLRCFAALAALPSRQNPGDFDYAEFYRGDGIRCSLHAESAQCLSVVEAARGFHLTGILDAVRAHGNQLFATYLAPRSAEMAAGILLGDRTQIETQRIETFMATGTIHLLVIAGLHLAILAGGLFWLGRRLSLPRGWAEGQVSLIILFYMLLVDAGPPVVRATVLVLTACAAAYLGRRPLGFNSLATAALVVLAINPTHLFHVGAQLSFLSVAGLVAFAPHWRRQRDPADASDDDSPKRRAGWAMRMLRAAGRTVANLFLVSCVISCVTTPLVMARFHLCTPIAILINAIVWLPMAVAMLSGFALLVVGGASHALAALCGAVCNTSLWLLELCVNAARRVPAGHFWVSGPADWWLIGFYGGLAVWAAFPRVRQRRLTCILMLLGWIGVGFVPGLFAQRSDHVDCTFVAVGHGTGVLLEFPSGKTLLYDAGQFGAPSSAVRSISSVLWSRGISRIDAVFLSHADVDHYNAMPGLLERFAVKAVYVSPAMFAGSGPAIAALHSSIAQRGIPVHVLAAGDRITDGECTLEVLHPPPTERAANTNAESIVLAVDFRGRRILLPGDLEGGGLAALLATAPRPCDVLMAPHHGSRQSNQPTLARWCRPRWVMFSDDGRWNLPEIDATYRAVGADTLHTNSVGAIHVRLDAQGATVTPFTKKGISPIINDTQ